MNAALSALANGLVFSALLAAFVWVALRLLKRKFNAATRYAICWVVLLAAVALPAFYFTAGDQRRIEPAGSSYGTTNTLATRPAPSSSNSTSAPRRPAATNPSWLPSLPIRVQPSSWTERFGELWELTSLLLLARLAAGFAALHFQKKYSRKAPCELRESMERCLTERGIKRRVRVALVPEGNSPMLAGVLRPCVLIPERLLSELDPAELEQILHHEVTHAARYDDWALLLQRVIQAVLVFYPVVHWVARRINLEQEAACDADVISVTGDARAYARCLTHVAGLSLGYWKSPLTAAIAGEKSYLTRRILMLLDKNPHTGTRLLKIRLTLAAMVVCLLAMIAATSPAFFVSAQSPDGAADWEKAAGGKMSFDVASVKQDMAGLPPSGPAPYSNFPLFAGDVFPPNGGRVSITNLPVFNFIVFAYKMNGSEARALGSQLQNWAQTERFDIEARAPEGTTKDQMRLMMQSLLADRFKFAMHYETRQEPIYDLVFVKPGKMGPRLRLYQSNKEDPCPTAPAMTPYGTNNKEALATVEGGFPAICGGVQPLVASSPDVHRIGSRNITVASFASSLALDRPIVDKTGINGTIDFVLEFYQAGENQNQPDLSPGPTYPEAMKDQLGLKLQPDTAPVREFVVDRVEQPTPN
jgi:bla regulator protein BlaR1